MAAATVTLLQPDAVVGNLRMVSAGSIVFAANGDTWAVPGIKTIHQINLTPTTAAAVHGFTVSGGTITLVSGGTITFRGGVIGI